MIQNPISVNPSSDQEEAAILIKQYELLALPVVDKSNKLIGQTTVNTALDVIQTEIAETRAPIIVERNLAVNTAGKGKYRGGAGQIVKITSISEQLLQFSFRPNFIQNPPLGLNGGKNGKNAEILINGKKVLSDPVIINKNEYVTVRTAGGGGLGKYSERSDLNKIKDKVDGIYS